MNATSLRCGMLLTLVLSATPEPHAQDLPRVAVLPLTNRTSWGGTELGRSAAALLTTELAEGAAFTLIERDRVDAVYEEWAIGHSGAIRMEDAVEIGRLLQAEYLLLGDVVRFNLSAQKVGIAGIGSGEWMVAENETSVRLISVGTSEIVAAHSAEGREKFGTTVNLRGHGLSGSSQFDSTIAERALKPAIRELATVMSAHGKRLAEEPLPEPASVPRIVGFAPDGALYLNQGENAGVEKGRRYRVLRVVGSIVDTDGKELDPVTEVVGVIEVIRVLSRSAIATQVDGEASAEDVLEPIAGP
jgi:curli biogenesis system outer membrane secretion channel CsgG